MPYSRPLEGEGERVPNVTDEGLGAGDGLAFRVVEWNFHAIRCSH